MDPLDTETMEALTRWIKRQLNITTTEYDQHIQEELDKKPGATRSQICMTIERCYLNKEEL